MKGTCVTYQEIENINEAVREMQRLMGWGFSWNRAASKLKRAPATIQKYFDEDWYPGKYYQKPKKVAKIPKELEHAGIYLLAQQVVVDGKIINLVKVGKSTNLCSRLASYQGMNPLAKCIDTLELYPEDLDRNEQSYHSLLGIKNKRYGNTEWFICDDAEYNYWTHYKLVAI